MPKALLFSDVTRRLKALKYDLVPGSEGLRVFTKTISAYFPYSSPRTVACQVEYDDGEIIPAEVVENIVLRLFLTTEEEAKFWGNDEPVH